MADILKTIKEELPSVITDATFEGANIVLYTDDKEFFKNGESKIKEVVSKVKKRIDLRADSKILASEAETEKTIRALVEEGADIQDTCVVHGFPDSELLWQWMATWVMVQCCMAAGSDATPWWE